ncbi:MAG: hypothetical protein R3F61_30205 [Myxococcota bacterium]
MRLVFLAFGLVLAGCSGGGEACDVDAETRCMDDAAETCTNGEWTVTDDCAANGQMCHQDDAMAAGEAHCM